MFLLQKEPPGDFHGAASQVQLMQTNRELNAADCHGFRGLVYRVVLLTLRHSWTQLRLGSTGG